jgi:uridine kinase
MNLLVVVEELLANPPRCGKTHIIAIDGPAGAGKTTLANALSLALKVHRNVNLIHLDEIYAGWDLALTPVLTEALSKILESVSSGNPAINTQYNWPLQQFTSTLEIAPSDVVIIEGVGSAQRVVRERATMTVWLDVDPHTGLERVLQRDIDPRTGLEPVLQRDGRAIREQMHLWQVREQAHFLADATRENVDFILSTI